METKLDKIRMKWLISKTRRSENQTQILFELCDCNFEKLKHLELQIKNCLISYCPIDKEGIEEILKMHPKVFIMFDNIKGDELIRLTKKY
ncbi:hypothetical protein M0Q50_06735 [bacterium]|jgi:hypothetical protein|nr:hypothetical protein [bacterium]